MSLAELGEFVPSETGWLIQILINNIPNETIFLFKF
jgi:hypothetical protein